MSVEVKIRIFGDDVFRRRIVAMRYRARDMSPVLNHIADMWADIIDEQFATEGKRGGTPWAQLARETYLKRGSKHPILIHTGDLFEAMGRDNIHVSDDEVTIHWPMGEEVKGAAHQSGYFNVLANRRVPARPTVAFNPNDRRKFREQITDYLVNGNL